MAGKKRLKWEPVAAMIALIFLGVWLVTAPRSGVGQVETRENARLVEHRIGNTRGAVEIVDNDGNGATFRRIYRDGTATDVMDADIFKQYFGQAAYDDVTSRVRHRPTGSGPSSGLLPPRSPWPVIWPNLPPLTRAGSDCSLYGASPPAKAFAAPQQRIIFANHHDSCLRVRFFGVAYLQPRGVRRER